MRKIIKTVLSFVICTGILVGGAYLYLSGKDINKVSNTDAAKNNIPYYENVPENCGVLVRMAETKQGILFYLDFKNKKITVISIGKCKDEKADYGGYSADYDIYADYDFISGFIDKIGGVNTVINGKKVRLTGVGVTEELKKEDNSVNKTQILLSAFETVRENGFEREDIAFLINTSIENDLSITECIYWLKYLPSMLNNVTFFDFTK